MVFTHSTRSFTSCVRSLSPVEMTESQPRAAARAHRACRSRRRPRRRRPPRSASRARAMVSISGSICDGERPRASPGAWPCIRDRCRRGRSCPWDRGPRRYNPRGNPASACAACSPRRGSRRWARPRGCATPGARGTRGRGSSERRPAGFVFFASVISPRRSRHALHTKVPKPSDPQLVQKSQTSAREAWRMFEIIAEFVTATERLQAIQPAVTVFGSARTTPEHPYYVLAEDIARRLSDAGFSVISGGGPGIMEAANKGCLRGPEPERGPEHRAAARAGRQRLPGRLASRSSTSSRAR